MTKKNNPKIAPYILNHQTLNNKSFRNKYLNESKEAVLSCLNLDANTKTPNNPNLFPRTRFLSSTNFPSQQTTEICGTEKFL